MKILSSKAHGILDYLAVAFLALSPSIFNMSLPASEFTYALAVIHLCLTLLTRFEPGIFKLIPLWLHGMIELGVSILLQVVTLFFEAWHDDVSYYFYIIFSVLLFFVWLISDYASPVIKRKKI